MKQINLKELWKHEALDFTPWLSKTRIIPDILKKYIINLFIYTKQNALFNLTDWICYIPQVMEIQ